MAKTYWVFWTYQANYGAHPQRVEADNLVEAMKMGTMYGGSLVWDGPAPRMEDSPGNIVMAQNIMSGRPTILGVDSEHENDLDWLYDVHVGPDTEHELPDHMVPFGQRVKSAIIVGNEDAPDAIYLSIKAQPDITDPLYRFL